MLTLPVSLCLRSNQISLTETRQRMHRFIRLVAERDECALAIIRQIEAGWVPASDALDALDRYLGERH
jgi:hypothetical protein